MLELGGDADVEAVAVWALIGAEAVRNEEVREVYGAWIGRVHRLLRGDEGAFTVILNGSLASRRPWAHAQIIPVCSPAQKRRAFALLSMKGPLRKAERFLHLA